MKFSEEILEQFDIEPPVDHEPVNVMKIRDMLDFLRESADRIVRKSRLYLETDDVDLEMDCLDIVTAKLNDFTQVFRDLVLFILNERGIRKSNPSLRYSIASFDTFGFQQTDAEKLFLQEMLLRNEITHDYFNREIHQQKLIWVMTNCCDGALDIWHDLNDYCTDHGLLDMYADHNA